jgi:hypothetical protein
MTTDLRNSTPREARLGRWVLLYSILQVLSTLSIDVQALRHTDGVRYFLCTDLKRLPEWVTNGQPEHLQASQLHSWCWQRSWDPTPIPTAPVELEASSSLPQSHSDIAFTARAREPPPPPRLTPRFVDGATLVQNDMSRISEKINDLSLSNNATHSHHRYSSTHRRRDNEEVIQSDLRDVGPLRVPGVLPDDGYRLPRSNIDSMNTDLGAYPFSPEEHVAQGYGYREVHQRESGVGYSNERFSTNGAADRSVDVRGGGMDRRSPRRLHERGGWS